MTSAKPSLFKLPTERVAEELIGMYLAHEAGRERTVGRIVETEAYLCEGDPACHAHRGMTRRNQPMFGPPGTAYIYLIYGMHYCFNVVTEAPGIGAAVLVRALEPVEGIQLMRERRKVDALTQLCSGPAKLVQALGIRPEENGTSLASGPIKLLERPAVGARRQSRRSIVTCERVGITQAADLPLRFYELGNIHVSKRSPKAERTLERR